MFRPDEDRLDYGNELLPPEGFHFVRAVATTYSLDFETLIAALVPLALKGDIDDKELYSNPIAILQAIRKVIGRLVIFCEAGQIKVPTSRNRLASLLDEVVVQVALPRKGRCYPSFHPKTWLVEYANNEGEHLWRFIVLSRNMSKDHSWDVAVSFEGEKRTGSYGATKDLVRFLEYLRGRVHKGAGTDRQWKVTNEMISSLAGVSFFCESPFDGFDIFPMGIDRDAKPVNIFKVSEPFDDLVVISPFLSPGLIKELNGGDDGTKEREWILISRAEALGKLEPSDADKFRKYMLREVTTESNERQDLHAKVYLRRRGSQTELWIGSANATESGTSRNVEMMVCLYCYNRHLNANKLMNDICGGDPSGKTSPLEEVFDVGECGVEVSDEEAARRAAEETIREICRLKMVGRVVTDGEQYRMSLNVPSDREFTGVTTYPINAPDNRMELRGDVVVNFREPMELEDLSSLFVFSVEYVGGKVERVVKVPVEGIPDARNDAILNKIVKDRSALLRYLAMLLSPNPALTLRQLDEAGVFLADGDGQQSSARLMPGLYEEMLIAAAESQERIREVGNLLGKIRSDDEVLSRYSKMYDCFAMALGLNLAMEIVHE